RNVVFTVSSTLTAVTRANIVKSYSRIACLSTPSVYQKLKQRLVEGSDHMSAVVLEYDHILDTYGQKDMAPQSFDIILADPPYLSEDRLTKVAQTVKYLANSKVLLCTGTIMEKHADKLMGLNICSFLPYHNLANEIHCFTKYTSILLS
uniref:EEF1A lysine methyltransferase 1 n=1 Tax=Hucho hucho TaxID=62062 RepID=A0A4W5MX90_9TELE